MEKTNSDLNKRISNYINQMTESLKNNPESLSEMEKKIANRAEANRATALKCEEEIDKLNDQIQQAQTRIRTLELQSQAALGKASGLYESLAVEKFNLDSTPEAAPESVEGQKEPEPVETNA